MCVLSRHSHKLIPELFFGSLHVVENEPLIPADTPFLLTTNPRFAEEAPNNSNSGIHINVVANDRYFDRPDVLKAFREQAVIQTPEYEAISESISVGGRFRPRNQDEVCLSVCLLYILVHLRFPIGHSRDVGRGLRKAS